MDLLKTMMETLESKHLPRHKFRLTDIAQRQSQRTSQLITAIKIK